MREVTEVFKLYKFSELSKDAKDKAIWDYLNTDARNEDFQFILDDWYAEVFPNSEIKYEYSLCYCQGDGFNTYGVLLWDDLENLRNAYGTGRYSKKTDEFIKPLTLFTDKEWRTLKFYSEYGFVNTKGVPLPGHKDSYAYDLSRGIDIWTDWTMELKYYGIRGIKGDLIVKLEQALIQMFLSINSYWCCEGYIYLYNMDEEEFSELADANEWEYYENGNQY